MKDVFKSLLLVMIPVILTMIFVNLSIAANSTEVWPRVLFELNDPIGDDWGPGNYTYPRYKHFEPYHGLFDLTNFSLVEDETDYILEFTFSEITDPWRSKYKFSHPLIELYFDNQPGGSSELFRPGAKVRFDENVKWDVMLHITGWWIKVFRPEDRKEAEKSIWSDPEYPFDVDNVVVTLEDNVIKIQIEKSVLGNLDNARFYLLVGAFDSFGPNYYREIKPGNDQWSFGGAEGNYYSRVLDILVPEGFTQEEVLRVTTETDEFVMLPYLTIGTVVESPLEMDKLSIWVAVLVISIILMMIVKTKSKKDSVHS